MKRNTSGENNPRSKLKKVDVVKIIKLLNTIPVSQIAEIYKLDPNTIYAIKSGKTWKCVPRNRGIYQEKI